MTNNWSRKHWILSGTLMLIVVCFALILYASWLTPLKEEAASLENQIESKQNTIQVIENESSADELSESDSRQLQSTLPVNDQEDQFLLMLERAEAASRTSIQSISGTGESAPVDDPEAAGEQKLTYELEMISESFGDLMQFLSKLEEMERHTVVESISFDHSTIEQGSIETLYYFVTVSAYYYPSLDLIESESPQYDFGQPGNKVTPFQTE